MIYGEYRDDAPRVMIPMRGERDEQPIEFVLDTAFDGDISLPPELLHRLGIVAVSRETRLMADGSITLCSIHYAQIEWIDGFRTVEVLSLTSRPLLGTALMNGCHIDIEAVEGGSVLVKSME